MIDQLLPFWKGARYALSFWVTALLFLNAVPGLAQCDCDHVISLSGSEWFFDGNTHNVKPGDKICFTSGTRTAILLQNIKGTASNPVVITNMCDGKVILKAPSNYGNTLEVINCQYIHLTGSGNPNVEYGIELGGASMGINFRKFTSNVECDHIMVHDVGCVGISAKTDGDPCDPATWRENFTFYDAHLHHNYVFNTGCEGFYVGNSHYDGPRTRNCNGSPVTFLESAVDGAHIHDNLMENIGNDGMQCGGCFNSNIHDNQLINIGTNNSLFHQNGIQVGEGSHGTLVHENTLDGTTGWCFFDQGGGSTWANNHGQNCLLGGFFLHDGGAFASKGFTIVHNNLINTNDYGLLMYSTNPQTSYFLNNIFVGANQSSYEYIDFNYEPNSKYVDAGNIKTKDINSIKFVNPSAKNFKLQATSPAIDAGVNLASYGVTLNRDLENDPRPLGSGFDQGVDEFTPNMPTSNAGSDQEITLPTTVLNINGSGFSNSGITGYAWTQISGATTTLSNQNTATLTVSGLTVGQYTFQLAVTDVNGTAIDQMTVTVLPEPINQSPTANAGANQTITLPNSSIVLNGTGSDPDGNVVSYSWSQTSGTTVTLTNNNSASVSISGFTAGVFQFRLTVTDNDGATGTSLVQVTVNPQAANIKPTVNAGNDINIYLPSNQAIINATASDSDGSIVDILWEKKSGPAATLINQNTLNLTVQNLTAQTYVFRITVTDNDGETAFDEVTVNVIQANQSPTVNAGTNETIVLPTHTIVLTASGSDADGTISSYSWSQQNGPSPATLSNANTASLTASGMTEGVYIFGVTVTDDDSATGYDEVQVTVLGATGNLPPTVNAGNNQIIVLPTSSITLTGQASDSDGSIQSQIWSQKSGPGTALLTNQNTLSLTVSSLNIAGIYIFTLTATDNQGLGAADDVMVTVLPSNINQAPVVNAGVNQYITLPQTSLQITGVASDPDGSISSMQWAKISGPNVSINNANTFDLQLTNLEAGDYVFRLTVTDNDNTSSSDQVQISVSASNLPPIVDAGTDQTITLPTNFTTLPAIISDPDGSISAIQWTQLSGPPASLSNETGQTLALVDLIAGTYLFEVSATDNDAASSIDEIYLIVNPASNNIYPTVSAGPDKEIFLPTNTAIIKGSSKDTDGTIASTLWSVTSGPTTPSLNNGNTPTVTVVDLEAGTYVLRLTATDNDGGTSFDEVTILVHGIATNQNPTANGGGDKIIQLPTNSITVTGTGTDLDGTISTFYWEKVSGPSATLATPNFPTNTITNLTQGVYIFRFTVTDNQGAEASDEIVITVLPASVNQAPNADAGLNQNIVSPTDNTNLAGSGYDADGNIVSYTWSKSSGPSGGTLTTPNEQLTSVTALNQGLYSYQLKVTDNAGAIGTDDVLINVTPVAANKLPVANAGSNQSISLPTNTVNVFGSGFDEDGNIVSYTWTKISGGNASISNGNKATATLSGLEAGQYTFRLRVADNTGATDDDFTTITVNDETVNIAPIAYGGGNQVIKLPQNSTLLSGTGSDLDGEITNYRWTQISGEPVTLQHEETPILNVSNLAEGIYVFRLTVTDNESATHFDEVRIQVVPASTNLPPNVSAGSDITVYLPQNVVAINGSANDDGTIASYLWSKISGPAATLTNPTTPSLTLQVTTEGVYKLQLTVIDDAGTSASTLITVTVFPQGANAPPIVNAGPDKSLALPLTTVVFDAMASDPEGSPLTYLWEQTNGTAVTMSGGNTLTLTLSNLNEGTYRFKFTATDNQGSSSSDDVQLIVNPIPPNKPPVVDAGINHVVVLPATTTQLSGSAIDNDGTVTKVVWSQKNGPSTATIQGKDSYTASVSGLQIGTYIFTFTATDDSGNTGSSNVIVFVSQDPEENSGRPIAFAGDDITVLLPLETEVTITGEGLDPNGFLLNYVWEQTGGTPIPFTYDENILNVTDLFEGVFTFTLTVIDYDSLFSSDEVILTIKEDFDEIPKFFSPNADATGNYWEFRNIEKYEQCRLVVFSRAGQEVFSARPYDNTWDGTYHGQPLNDGDYYYVLNCDDGQMVKGAVRIIR